MVEKFGISKVKRKLLWKNFKRIYNILFQFVKKLINLFLILVSFNISTFNPLLTLLMNIRYGLILFIKLHLKYNEYNY
jgi:hypothetical protein